MHWNHGDLISKMSAIITAMDRLRKIELKFAQKTPLLINFQIFIGLERRYILFTAELVRPVVV